MSHFKMQCLCIMQPFLLLIVQVCMVDHCLDAVCTVPDRVVTYRMYTVCFSVRESIPHLNVCTEKPVISDTLQLFRYETKDLLLQSQCYMLFIMKNIFRVVFLPFRAAFTLKKFKNSTYMVTDISHFYRGGKEEGKMQKSSSSQTVVTV